MITTLKIIIWTLKSGMTVIILKALNVMDPDVRVTEDDDFRCLGTILGKVQGEYELRLEQNIEEKGKENEDRKRYEEEERCYI